MENDILEKKLKSHSNDSNTLEKILQTAINLFLTFCEKNWNPHPNDLVLEQFLGMEWPKSLDVLSKLQRDSEPLYTNILYPELLYFASQLFSALYAVDQNLVSLIYLICF